MRTNFKILLTIAVIAIVHSCNNSSNKSSNADWVKNAISRSSEQLLAASETFKDSLKNPRTFEDGKVRLVGEKDWTSGFFPG
ncbi:glucuronyl hydrolase, partial [bacterium]|nr:glucuronyl hydrolase [bacterium]